MTTKNDIMFSELGDAGFAGGLNDRLINWLDDEGITAGTVADRWIAFLNAEGITAGSLGDRKRAYYDSLGAAAAATLGDGEKSVWETAPPTVP